MEALDIPERLLVRSVCDNGQLSPLIVIFLEEAVCDICKKLRTFLDWIKPAWPEEERRIRIFFKPERMLQRELVLALHLAMVIGTILKWNLIIRSGIIGRIRRIQNTRRAPGVEFRAHFIANRIRNERMPAVYDFLKECRRNSIDKVRSKYA